jgi:hypothetical protein
LHDMGTWRAELLYSRSRQSEQMVCSENYDDHNRNNCCHMVKIIEPACGFSAVVDAANLVAFG